MIIDILATLKQAREALENLRYKSIDPERIITNLTAAIEKLEKSSIEQIEKAEPVAEVIPSGNDGGIISVKWVASFDIMRNLKYGDKLYLHPAAPTIPENIDELSVQIMRETNSAIGECSADVWIPEYARRLAARILGERVMDMNCKHWLDFLDFHDENKSLLQGAAGEDAMSVKDVVSFVKEIERLRAEVAALKRNYLDMLCIIHRDGGHYIAEHGENKAHADACEKLHRWTVLEDEIAALKAPVGMEPVIWWNGCSLVAKEKPVESRGAWEPLYSAAQLAQVQRERDAYKKDAERYRWLRDQNNPLERFDFTKQLDNGTSCYHIIGEVRELKHGVALDIAIDAAMQKEKE